MLCVDHYEVLRLLDTWLRQAVTPTLPENVAMLLAGTGSAQPGMEPPSRGRRSRRCFSDHWKRRRAQRSRARWACPEEDVAPIVRFSRGHALTLVLGALAAKERPAAQIQDVALSRLLDEFTRAYLDDLDERTQRVLEAAAVVRRLSTAARWTPCCPVSTRSQALEVLGSLAVRRHRRRRARASRSPSADGRGPGASTGAIPVPRAAATGLGVSP